MRSNSDKNCSIYFKNTGTPLLVQPRLIRSLGGGQVDYSYVFNDRVYIIEAKKSGTVSVDQIIRLKKSVLILSELLEFNAELRLYVDDTRKVFSI